MTVIVWLLQRQLFDDVLAAAQRHQCLVDGDAVQPRREAGVAAKRIQTAKDLQESVLRELFGDGMIPYHAPGKSKDASIVLLVEPVKGGGVAGLGPGDDIRFVRFA